MMVRSAAALREAEEETGLDPAGVDVLATLPAAVAAGGRLRRHARAGVVAEPSPVAVVDEAEVASVHRMPVAQFVDPANRLRVHHSSGHLGPAFRVDGLLVWGFTAGMLSGLLEAGGLSRPWDRGRVERVPVAEEASAR